MYAFILLVIVAFTINTGYCIKCYNCHNWDDKKCLDPFVKNDMGQTECSSTIAAKVSNIFKKIPGFQKAFSTEFQCVKLNVTTAGFNHLTRSCIPKPAANDYCEKLTKSSKSWFSLGTVHYCGTCESDGCNGVGKVKGIWLAIIVACLVCVIPKLLPNLW